MLDYVVSLREGIMDAWAGAIMAMKAGGKGQVQFKPREPKYSILTSKTAEVMKPYADSIFRLLHIVSQEQSRSEGLLRSAMGVIG